VRDALGAVKRFLCVNGERAGWDSYDAFVEQGDASRPARDVQADDDVYQMYTSGTTGRPKGAIIQHRALAAQLYQGQTAFGVRTGDRSLIVAPLYHAAAAVTAFVTVQSAGTLVIQEEFVPPDVIRALSDEDINVALLVPAMIQFCLIAVPDATERDYSSLRTIIYGASPISEAVLRQAIDAFGCDFLQGYGMTETTAAATYLMPSDHEAALSGRPELLLSAGRPVLGTEIRIVDAEDEPVPTGELGEVCIRGPQVMRGYWNRPDATEESLKDGWMHTGDAGRLDDQGYLFIQDRVKDMIVSGGENVYPREIEEVLFAHDGVADTAVIGIPDDKWGEAVLAFVVRAQGADMSADDLIEHCRSQLAGYKQPRRIAFIDELPRDPSGRVLKTDLRAPFWRDHDRRVG
jgi:acyl-CoA synthetase (AMP-forming)/AMP-acid ligase II